jgi:hypothetical protein
MPDMAAVTTHIAYRKQASYRSVANDASKGTVLASVAKVAANTFLATSRTLEGKRDTRMQILIIATGIRALSRSGNRW